MKIRNSKDKTSNTGSQSSPPIREVNTREATDRLVRSFSEWAGPEHSRSDDYMLFLDALESGATLYTASGRVGLEKRRLNRFLEAQGTPFDEFRDLILKIMSNSLLLAEQALAVKNPEKYLKTLARQIAPDHPILADESPRIEQKAEEKPAIVDYSGSQDEVRKLAQMYIEPSN